MKFRLFGYSVSIIKLSSIDDMVAEVCIREGKVAAVRFYREKMLSQHGVHISLKEGIEKINVLAKKLGVEYA